MDNQHRSVTDDNFRSTMRDCGDKDGSGDDSMVVVKGASTNTKAINEDARTIDFIISTEEVDRMGDTIRLAGWDLSAYKANPVVLFGHNSSQPPVARAKKVWKDNTDKTLRATAEFATAEVNPLAETVWQLYAAGYMRATSVGFIPKKWEWAKDDEGNWTDGREYGINFMAQELLEFSAVPVPANSGALVDAKGIDLAPMVKWAERTLDTWDDSGDVLGMPHNDVIQLYKDLQTVTGTGPRAYHRVNASVRRRLLDENLATLRAAADASAGDSVDEEDVDLLSADAADAVDGDATAGVDETEVVVVDSGEAAADEEATVDADVDVTDDGADAETADADGAVDKDDADDSDDADDAAPPADTEVVQDDASEVTITTEVVDIEQLDLASGLDLLVTLGDQVLGMLDVDPNTLSAYHGTRAGKRGVANVVGTCADLQRALSAVLNTSGEVDNTEVINHPDDELGIEIVEDDVDAAETEEIDINPEDVVGAVKELLPDMVSDIVEREIRRLQGRLD